MSNRFKFNAAALIALWAAGGAIAAALCSGCKNNRYDEAGGGAPAPVSLTVVHDPFVSGYLKAQLALFHTAEPNIAGGRKVQIRLLELPELAAADQIATGKIKADAWVTPSRALVKYLNSKVVNLGSKQVDCKQIFGSPVILATRPENLWRGADGVQPSWNDIFAAPAAENPDRAPAQAKAVLYHGLPFAAPGGLPALINLAAIAIAGGLEIFDLPACTAVDCFGRLQQLEQSAEAYSADEQALLARAALPPGDFRRFVLTTEQMMIRYNQSAPADKRLAALYLAEGSFWQDYSLCRAEADWMTPDRRAALRLLADFLILEPAQRAAMALGFRPARLEGVSGPPLTKEWGVSPDLPKLSILPPSAELTAELISRWPELRRPAAMVFVIDSSNSMQGAALETVRSEIRNYIAQRGPRDQTAIIAASSQAALLSDFTSDRERLEAALNRIEAIGGAAFYDGLNLAVQLFNRNQLPNHRRILVAVVDGDDKSSEISQPLLVSAIGNTLSHKDISLLIIGIRDQGLRSEPLNEIAAAGRGALKLVTVSGLRAALEQLPTSF